MTEKCPSLKASFIKQIKAKQPGSRRATLFYPKSRCLLLLSTQDYASPQQIIKTIYVNMEYSDIEEVMDQALAKEY